MFYLFNEPKHDVKTIKSNIEFALTAIGNEYVLNTKSANEK